MYSNKQQVGPVWAWLSWDTHVSHVHMQAMALYSLKQAAR